MVFNFIEWIYNHILKNLEKHKKHKNKTKKAFIFLKIGCFLGIGISLSI